jgi:hypothetical protein
MKYIDVIDVEIVKFPSYIVDPSEYIELVLVVIHGMSISNGRKFPIIFEPLELGGAQTEAPNVIESTVLILAAKDINVVIVSGYSATGSGTGDI